MDRDAVKRIAASSMPGRIAVDEDPSLEARYWILRFARIPEKRLDELTIVVQRAARGAVCAAREERRLDPAAAAGRVEVSLHLVDQTHLIIEVVTTCLERDDAHAWLVAASAAIDAIDQTSDVEELQGFPRPYWPLLLRAHLAT